MSLNLHPKVGWPLLVNALLTVLVTVALAFAKGGGAAALSAAVGGLTTLVGLVTGYSVPAGGWQPAAPTTPTAGGGAITTAP